jgi:2'-5' RNA ligase
MGCSPTGQAQNSVNILGALKQRRRTLLGPGMGFYFSMERSSADETVRLFVALPVPAAVREELRGLQTELRTRLSGDCVRWTRPEQIHLTFRFLGEVEIGQVEGLVAAVRGVCDQFAPLQLRAERMGVFPHARSPRVVWVSVQDEGGELSRLQPALSEAAGRFTQHKEEKSFTGHLTIGRLRNVRATQARVLAEFVEGVKNQVFGQWTADQVEILRSELSPAGSRYSSVASLPLSGAVRHAG